MTSELRFGRFRLDLSRRALWADGAPAKLGPRAMDVLLALAARRERFVPKNELLDIVWPTTVVEENNLQVHVWSLRRLLGPEAITTIPGRGYRFTAPLEQAPAAPRPVPERPAVKWRSHLPAHLPPLIGREDELAALAALMGAHPLVSIVGAGGMGKTRLAQQLLRGQQLAHADGLGWVELAGLSDPALVAGSIAGTLGLQTGSGDALDGLVTALRGLDAVVVLDNAEHLVDEVARVVQALLDGAPRLKLVVTSQLPLRLAGEQVYRLGPLALPAPDAPFEVASRCGAVALFEQRARAVDRRFVLTPQNLAPVVDVCRRLDGLALAIELAAARLPLLGLAQLAAALDARLRLLTSGSRTAPARQQTLRAALEWSHGLLGAAEQQVFRRLGVFAGGFTLALAQQVVADETIDAWGVVDAVGSLVERSLVVLTSELQADDGGAPRYRLLESARVLALEQLAAAGEAPALRRRHALALREHLGAVDTDCWEGRIGFDAAWTQLEPELDNAREALAWALAEDPPVALALAPAMDLALTRDRRQEARLLWETTADCAMAAQKTAQQVAADGGGPLDEVLARWALGCAIFWSLHRPALSDVWSRVAQARFRRLGDARGEYLALAVDVLNRVQPEPPYERNRAALRAMKALESPAWPARVRYHGARAEYFLELFCGDHAATLPAAQRTLALAQAAGDASGVNAALVNLADLSLAAGRAADAVRHGRELEQRLAGTRHLSNLAFARLNLTAAALASGDCVLARAVAQRGWPLALAFDLQDSWSDALALLAVLEGRPRASARLRGYGDRAYASSGFTRESNEVRMAERGERLARERLGPALFERLRAEGREQCDEQVAALAFASDDA